MELLYHKKNQINTRLTGISSQSQFKIEKSLVIFVANYAYQYYYQNE